MSTRSFPTPPHTHTNTHTNSTPLFTADPLINHARAGREMAGSSSTAWLVAQGGMVSPHIEVASHGADERGVFAKDTLAEGATLLSVPSHLLLTAGRAKTIFRNHTVLSNNLDEEHLIALALLHEKFICDESSLWDGWLPDLPSSFDSMPVFWSEDDDVIQELLACPTMASRVGGRRTDVEEQLNDVRLALQEVQSSLTCPGWTKRLLVLLTSQPDLYLWAASTLESRGKYLQDSELGAEKWCIVPVGDMFNHAAAYLTANVIASYDAAASAFRYVTARPIDAGEELCLNYGPHDNLTLLHSYGFVLANNPNDRSLVPPIEDLADDDLCWLEEHGLAVDTHALEPSGPSWGLLSALRLKHATQEERAHGAGFAILDGGSVSARCERLVWAEARRMAVDRLNMFAEDGAVPPPRVRCQCAT